MTAGQPSITWNNQDLQSRQWFVACNQDMKNMVIIKAWITAGGQTAINARQISVSCTPPNG